MNKLDFKLGEIVEDIWAGEFEIQCEFIANIGLGIMIFRDINDDCYRAVYYDGKGLNGWIASDTIQDLKKEIHKVIEDDNLVDRQKDIKITEEKQSELDCMDTCPNCDEKAWDGRICHLCGAKDI